MTREAVKTERFERHARTVSLLTMASRVTGLFRDAALSRAFGAGALSDAFFFAFLIPNLFRRLFGEGALSAAFLPAYAQVDRDDPATARGLAALTLGGVTVVLGVVVVLAEIALATVAFDTGTTGIAARLTMLMLPYTPLVCLVALLGAMLQVHGRFGPTAAAPIVLNGCLIAVTAGGAAWLEQRGLAGDAAWARRHVTAVAAVVVVAGVLQVAWSLSALRGRRAWSWSAHDMQRARAPFRRVLGQAVPMMVGLGVLQLNTLFDGLIASYPTAIGPTIFGHHYPLAEGAMASLNFAQRLYQFPLGVFGIAVATAIFPALARQAGDVSAFGDTVRRGLRLVVFIGLPASVGLVFVRDALATVILQGGAFTAEDSARVGFILLGYAPAIWAYSMTHVLTRAFYARQDAKTPVRIAVGVVGLNLALNCVLIWTPLREAGLAWSTATSAVVQVVMLMIALRRRMGFRLDRGVARSWASAIVASGVMAGALAIVTAVMPDPAGRWGASTGLLAAQVTTGIAVFVVASVALRMRELSWVLAREGAG